MDEKGFIIGVLQKTKRVFTKADYERQRLLGAGQDGSREWITVIVAVSQDGRALPPYIIYPAVPNNIHDTWVNDFEGEDPYIHFTSSQTS